MKRQTTETKDQVTIEYDENKKIFTKFEMVWLWHWKTNENSNCDEAKMLKKLTLVGKPGKYEKKCLKKIISFICFFCRSIFFVYLQFGWHRTRCVHYRYSNAFTISMNLYGPQCHFGNGSHILPILKLSQNRNIFLEEKMKLTKFTESEEDMKKAYSNWKWL